MSDLSELGAYYGRLMRDRFTGKKLVLATGSVAASGWHTHFLKAMGAESQLLLANEALPEGGLPPGCLAEQVDCQSLPVRDAVSVMDFLKRYERLLQSLPEEVSAAVEAFDPEARALVIPIDYLQAGRVAERAVYGARAESGIRLEDKTLIDALWDEAGLRRAPSRVVVLDSREPEAAYEALNRGRGVVLAGDAREGWHGAGEKTRWATTRQELSAVLAFLGQRCRHARVMPFLEGVSCSIHGLAFPDYVAAFRPVENVVLHPPGTTEFRFWGNASFWEPGMEERAGMRNAAKRVGAILRDRHGFFGAFSIDGVLTREGFLPTELNPRFSAGLGAMARVLTEFPLYYLHLALCHGEAWPHRAEDIEAACLHAFDRQPVAAIGIWERFRQSETRTVEAVRTEDGGFREMRTGEDVDLNIRLGPSPIGGRVFFQFTERRLAAGPSVTPLVARAAAFCEQTLGLGLGAPQTVDAPNPMQAEQDAPI